MKRFNALGLILTWSATAPLETTGQSARVELDHVFIVVRPQALAEIAALRSVGLTVRSEPSKHEGQGTASVAVLFENAYLELIWVDSSVSVDREHENTLQWFRNAEGWQTSGRSPFGLGLRRLTGDTASLPVPVKREAAEWLEPGSAYELLQQPSDSLAADFFVVPSGAALPSWISRRRQRAPDLFQHRGGGREVTLVRVHGAPAHEPASFRVLRPKPVVFARSSVPVLELELDRGVRRQRVDLRPILPLVLMR